MSHPGSMRVWRTFPQIGCDGARALSFRAALGVTGADQFAQGPQIPQQRGMMPAQLRRTESRG